ncbi:MAG: NAD-dependent epimerase/dehydratase family protein [Planctomycetota bacterium]
MRVAASARPASSAATCPAARPATTSVRCTDATRPSPRGHAGSRPPGARTPAATRAAGEDVGERRWLTDNAARTRDWAELCVRDEVGVLVLASTRSVFDPATDVVPFAEDATPHPSSPYGRSKHAAEREALVFAGPELRVCVLRLAQLVGPGQDPTSFVARAAAACREGRAPELWGAGTGARDWLWVGDACEAFVAAVTRHEARGVVHVGAGRATSLRDVAVALMRAHGVAGEPVARPERAADEDRAFLAVGRARALLGWQPRTPLERWAALV